MSAPTLAQPSMDALPRSPRATARVASDDAGFWLIALVFVTGMAFSTLPHPAVPAVPGA